MLPSRVDLVKFRDRKIYVKRDDLLDDCLSGNKYRKLYTLIQTPREKYTKIISYGGAQSNAMLSIACLCKSKGWTFDYYTKNLPELLKDGVEGNLELAIARGMIVHEVAHEDFDKVTEALQKIKEEKTLVISQGGADATAQEGVSLLAEEINIWKKEKEIAKLAVVLPSGTGTTALYLKAMLDDDIAVYTSVLVGDETYQRLQWKRLSEGPYPEIFPSTKKMRFAKPYNEYLQMHKELLASTSITFDLIYAPFTWIQMLENLQDKEEILYIHTGGVSGNETMLQRYRHKEARKR